MKKILVFLAIFSISIINSAPSNAMNYKLSGMCLHQSALYGVTEPVSHSPEIMEEINYAYPIAGESHRADNSMSLLKKYGKDTKFEYSETGIAEDDAYKIFITQATLVPEPKNKFDKFAVKVLIKGKHVGYIPASFSYEVSLMMHKAKKKSLTVKSCISHYPGGEGPQVTLDLPSSFLGDNYADGVWHMEKWFHYNDYYESGPGAKCTKYFSKWYCGPFEK
jgi:hypothetical protein